MSRIVLAVMLCAVCRSAVCDDEPNFARWEKDIQRFESQIADGQAKPGEVLFIGSSSIRMWKLDESFPEKDYVNFGFGGSEVADSLHFFDRVVKPLQPRAVVMYAGDNDVAKGKTAERVHSDFQKFVARVKEDLPEQTRVLYIAIKPSLKRWELREEMAKANGLIESDCGKDDRLEFVDIWTPMLGQDGTPQPTLFAKDGLHLNDDGYKLWTSVLSEDLSK